MADTLTPQTPTGTPTGTPTKKLFKPSSKTKTPTLVRRTNSTSVTPRTVQSATFSASSGSPAQRKLAEKPALATQPSVQSIQSPSESVPEDIAKSTTLAPLTSSLNTSSNKLPEYATSDTTSDTPIGLVDHDLFTPSDTVSRSTGARRSSSRDTTGTLKRAVSETGDEPHAGGEIIDTASHSSKGQIHEDEERLKGSLDPPDNTKNVQKGSEGAPTPSNISGSIKSPTAIANYFAESGNQELSDFVKALAGDSSHSAAVTKVDDITDSKEPLPGALEELPTDDTLVAEPSNRIKEAAGPDVGEAMQTTTEAKPADAASNAAGISLADKKPDLPDPSTVSQKAEGARRGILKTPGAAPTNGDRHGSSGSAISPEVAEDGTQSFDNMGKPTHIERSIEIPFERPSRRQSVVHSPPTPSKPDLGNIGNSLEDPPEEILDPSVHSPSATVSPIPKIPKITPIGMAPPQNLSQLARGLGGKTVDDVGNIVDESGNVLGHALGDLPAMVGKKVTESGEIYGDSGELIGYVTENFTDSAPTPHNPAGPWGGLQIDHDGNILDAGGNIIGRFFQKPGEKGQVPPSGGNPQQDPKLDQNPKQEEKPKVNAHTGGSPSDIFLDVKSTTDGIQLTIRIPTTFGLQRQDSENRG